MTKRRYTRLQGNLRGFFTFFIRKNIYIVEHIILLGVNSKFLTFLRFAYISDSYVTNGDGSI